MWVAVVGKGRWQANSDATVNTAKRDGAFSTNEIIGGGSYGHSAEGVSDPAIQTPIG